MRSAALLTLLSVATFTHSLPLDNVDSPVSAIVARQDAGSGAYKLHTGDGKNWPKMSEWVGSFETMFKANEGIMAASCTQFGTKNNSPEEIQQIKSGVKAKAKSSGLDPRFIFAIIMQETKGCVRAPTTANGVTNPGLMQTHNGVGCTAVPCPKETIYQMIKDGAEGTAHGDGLKQCLAKANGKDATAYYIAARIYNTGSYPGGDLGKPVTGTACYSSDVANRLTGWTGAGGEACHLKI
ncbi:putative muramidase [Bisporella sp. PMI_857]|nr:putative muramidase [Bisporella sp. PMI_857]